jgi:hypothetical protein
MMHLRLPHLLLFAAAVAMAAPAHADGDTDAVKSQVLRLYKDFKGRDWKDIYDVIGLAKGVSMGTREQFAADFDQGIKQGDPGDMFSKLIDGMADVQIGAVMIEGEYAYVPTYCSVTIDGSKARLMGIAKMRKVDGTWRWDLTFTDDTEKAAAARTQQLFGEPVTGLEN